MKACFTILTIFGLVVWNVGCGSAEPETPVTPVPDTNTDLGAPGGIEAGSATGGMDEDTTEDTTTAPSEEEPSETAPSADTPTEEGATGGPALPEVTDE